MSLMEDGGDTAKTGEGIVLWDLKSDSTRTIDTPDFANCVLAFSPDGSGLYAALPSNRIVRFDTRSGSRMGGIEIQNCDTKSLAFQPGSNILRIYAIGGKIIYWDTAADKEIKRLAGFAFGNEREIFSPRGDFMLFASWGYRKFITRNIDDMSISVIADFDLASGMPQDNQQCFELPGDRGLLTLSDNLLTVSGVEGAPEKRIALEDFDAKSVSPSPDGNFALLGETKVATKKKGRLVEMDLKSGKPRLTIEAHAGAIAAQLYTPDGKRMISGGEYPDNSIAIWDRESGIELKRLKLGIPVTCMAISADGRRLIVGCANDTNTDRVVPLYCYDLSENGLLRELPDPNTKGHAKIVWTCSCDISADGKRGLSSTTSEAVCWDLDSGKVLSRLPLPNGWSQVSFDGSRPGAYVYDDENIYDSTGNHLKSEADSTIMRWDPSTGSILGSFKVEPLVSFHVARDGKRIFASLRNRLEQSIDASTGTVLLNTCVAAEGERWISWTPDGYWDGSKDCGSLAAMVKGMESWNIDQFAVRNNRPDIILQRLGSKDSELAARFAAQYRKRLRRLGIAESELRGGYEVPSTEIASARQDDKFVDLDLSFAASGSPLKSYHVYANDVPLFGATGKPISGNQATAKERIELVAGDNKIEVSCMDSGGDESFRRPRSFAWGGKVKPSLYYLGFGVSKYKDPAIKSLGFAAKDASDLGTAFKAMEGGGFAKVYAKSITDDQVTPQAIREAKAFLKEAKPDDTFVLFIAGHGIQLSSAKTPGAAAPIYYYVTSNAKLSDIAGTAADFERDYDLQHYYHWSIYFPYIS